MSCVVAVIEGALPLGQACSNYIFNTEGTWRTSNEDVRRYGGDNVLAKIEEDWCG